MESMVDDAHDSRDGEREDEGKGETTISRHFLLAPRFKKVACEREGGEGEQPPPSQPACQHAEGTKPCRREFRLRLRDK